MYQPRLQAPNETIDLAVLAAAVRANEERWHRLDTAVRLAGWAAEGRAVTSTSAPRPADAAEAAHACGLEVPHGRITRAAQIAGLIEAWDLALGAGLLVIVGNRALAGPNLNTWPNGPAANVLSAWLSIFAQSNGFVPAEDGIAADDHGMVVLAVLEVLAQGPQPVAQLRSAVEKALVGEAGSAIAYIRLSIGGDPVSQVLHVLEDWGLAEDGAIEVSLTPLGTFACRQFDLGPGEQFDPVLDAAALLAAMAGEPERGPRAATAWLNARNARAAAAQLLAAAAVAGPVSRLMAIMLVQELGGAVLAAWKKAAKDPYIGPYARHVLWEAGAGPEPKLADGAWMAADLAAAMETLGTSIGGASAELQELTREAFGNLDPQQAAALRSASRQRTTSLRPRSR